MLANPSLIQVKPSLYWFYEEDCGIGTALFFLARIQIFSHLPLLVFSVLISIKTVFLNFSWLYFYKSNWRILGSNFLFFSFEMMFFLSPAMQGSAYCSEVFLLVMSLLMIHFLFRVLKILDDVSQSFFDPSETVFVLIYWKKVAVSGLRCFFWLVFKFLVTCHCSFSLLIIIITVF